MTRKFTPLYTSIWQDAEFVSLRPESQALYFALISQPNINSVGLLPITGRRWRTLAKWSDGQFTQAFDELEQRTFILVDHDTEELWIRTFIKWDGGVNHALRLKAILKDAKAIQSLSLRHSIGTELARLGVSGIGTPEAPPDDPEGTRVPTVPMSSYVTTIGTGNPLDEPGEVTYSAAAEPSPFCPKHPNGTDDDCGRCGTARRRLETWKSQAKDRKAAELAERAALKAACTDCNSDGWVEDMDGAPVRRCNHKIGVSA